MDIPPYSSDTYAEKFLTGKTIFPSDGRIFHRADHTYDDVVTLGKASFDGGVITIDLTHLSGAPAVLTVRRVRAGVLRIQYGRPEAVFDEQSPMLLPEPEAAAAGAAAAGAETVEAVAAAEQAGTFEEGNGCLLYHFDGYTLMIDRSPFCLRVISPKGETIFESETEKMVGLYTAPPLGLRREPGQEALPSAFLSWHMRNADRWFGLGEKFNRFEKTGTRSTVWQADTCGSTTTDMSYKSVPVLFSTAGWALMLHSSFRSFWEVGAVSYATGSLLVEDEKMDLFLILAPTLKEQVTLYTALTGRPAMPPRWAFGVWMSRAAYTSRPEMLEVAARLRQEEIPCDVFHIDPSWMEHGYYNDIGVEVCNFNWDYAAWGDPRALFEEFAAQNQAICLWINPYFSEDSPAYAEAQEQGYLVRTGSGTARLELGLAAGMVDFTNPAAKAWWQKKLVGLLNKGASVFKVDFGDRVPEDALFANGRSGREMHNLYPHLYAEAVWEVVERVCGKGILWRRPGYIGSQRFPCCWAGDTQVSWEGMAGALRGGLSASFTGESFWSHDIGGFVGAVPSDELYIRWAQWGLLSPFARFHGNTPREPWHFGPRAVEIVRAYARLRYALLPYLMACASESTESGLPMLRPLVMEFPNEPRVETIDDQYMLGQDLLVAPIFQAGATARQIYFPSGQWWPMERLPGLAGATSVAPTPVGPTPVGPTPVGPTHVGTTAAAGHSAPVAGPGYHLVDAPLEKLPIFVRGGAVIARYRQAPLHLKGPTPTEWQLDIYPGESRRRLVIIESGFIVIIQYRFENGAGHLEVSPAPIHVAVRLIDRRQPPFLRATGGGALQPGDSTSNFIADASQGINVEFRA